MKRIITITAIALCILATGQWSYAQGRGKGYGRCAGNRACYVDKNGDGICDNAGLRASGKGRGKGRQFRNNNAPGTTAQHGPRYVDKNGDGICDNYQGVQNTAK